MCIASMYINIKVLIKVEPYWNVNRKLIIKCCNNNVIKVEPYWNVNLHLHLTLVVSVSIKVEPYWNVNSHEIMPNTIKCNN